MVLTHAAAVHGVDVQVEPVNLARIALKRLGLTGKSRARDRRPTTDEIERLPDHFDDNRYLLIPMGRIVRFAIASAMREEICRIRWSEVDVCQHVVLVRDRKDPREKSGNDQFVPLLDMTGFDALRLIRVQRQYENERLCQRLGRTGRHYRRGDEPQVARRADGEGRRRDPKQQLDPDGAAQHCGIRQPASTTFFAGVSRVSHWIALVNIAAALGQ